jgi:hypothetical protein
MTQSNPKSNPSLSFSIKITTVKIFMVRSRITDGSKRKMMSSSFKFWLETLQIQHQIRSKKTMKTWQQSPLKMELLNLSKSQPTNLKRKIQAIISSVKWQQNQSNLYYCHDTKALWVTTMQMTLTSRSTFRSTKARLLFPNWVQYPTQNN